MTSTIVCDPIEVVWRDQTHAAAVPPGRYVGAEAQDDDGEPFDEKMKRLVAQMNVHLRKV